MKPLKITDGLGVRFYRYDVEATTGYNNGENGTIAAAPLIHTYSPQPGAVYSRLALKKNQSPIFINKTEYQVSRFLTTQTLNNELLKDNDQFSPSVKPHYALTPVNGKGEKYIQSCKIMLFEGKNVLFHGNQTVFVHDGRLSPCVEISVLKNKLKYAHEKEEHLLLTSYVIDTKNKNILITAHCLLNQKTHDEFFSTIDQIENPNIEELLQIESPIKEVLQEFDTIDTESDLLLINQVVPAEEANYELIINQQYNTEPAAENPGLDDPYNFCITGNSPNDTQMAQQGIDSSDEEKYGSDSLSSITTLSEKSELNEKFDYDGDDYDDFFNLPPQLNNATLPAGTENQTLQNPVKVEKEERTLEQKTNAESEEEAFFDATSDHIKENNETREDKAPQVIDCKVGMQKSDIKNELPKQRYKQLFDFILNQGFFGKNMIPDDAIDNAAAETNEADPPFTRS